MSELANCQDIFLDNCLKSAEEWVVITELVICPEIFKED